MNKRAFTPTIKSTLNKPTLKLCFKPLKNEKVQCNGVASIKKAGMAMSPCPVLSWLVISAAITKATMKQL